MTDHTKALEAARARLNRLPKPGEYGHDEDVDIELICGALLSLAGEAGWKPIADAPKDEVILVGHRAVDDAEGEVIMAYDNGKTDWCWEIPDSDGCCRSRAAFTHYRPLPAPPSAEEK